MAVKMQFNYIQDISTLTQSWENLPTSYTEEDLVSVDSFISACVNIVARLAL